MTNVEAGTIRVAPPINNCPFSHPNFSSQQSSSHFPPNHTSGRPAAFVDVFAFNDPVDWGATPRFVQR
jgi:hypothetical protein